MTFWVRLQTSTCFIEIPDLTAINKEQTVHEKFSLFLQTCLDLIKSKINLLPANMINQSLFRLVVI